MTRTECASWSVAICDPAAICDPDLHVSVVEVLVELRPGRTYRGRLPRDTLTREKIIKAAIDLLDSDGLEGLNIRALGSRLGSAATAIYWHVDSKDNLIALAADQAWNEIALPDLAAAGSRDAATAMAARLHAILTPHPCLLQPLRSFLPFAPRNAPPHAPPTPTHAPPRT